MQSFSQQQKQNQQLKILPQQIQFLNLLQLNAADLEQYVERELEENPFLEEGYEPAPKSEVEVDRPEEIAPEDFDDPIAWESMDDEMPDYQARTESGFQASEERMQPLNVQTESFREELKRQAHFLSLDHLQRELVDYLIDCLDEGGFLRLTADTIVDDFAFTRGQYIESNVVEEAISTLQSLDPPGIGARDVRECLMLQLDRMEAHEDLKPLAIKVIDRFLPQLAAHSYEQIMQVLEVDSNEMVHVLDLVKSLNPRPLQGIADATETVVTIQPDFIVESEGETLIASINSVSGASVRISPDAGEYLTTYTDKKAKAFVKQKIEDARWLVEALRQRNETLLRTIQAIVEQQRHFFLTGDYAQLKPMILRDIAEKVHLDVSTISRITSTKHVQTDFGIIPLKDLFFQTFTGQDGKELTNREIQEVLSEIIQQEDKRNPYNDSELQELLEKRGYLIARRTVAKYRDTLGIPIADQRRELRLD